MRQLYYPRKQQEERCSYCKNLEKESDYEISKVNTLNRFLTKTTIPLNQKEKDKLSNEMINTVLVLEETKRKLSSCKFPYCNGKCGNNE